MKRALLTLGCALCAPIVLLAQTGYTYATGQSSYPGYQQWQVSTILVPTTATIVTGTSGAGTPGVFLGFIQCSTGATADTITIVDAVSGTPIWQAVPIAAHTAYSWNFNGQTVAGGVKWSSSAGAAYCWLRGGY